MVLLFVSSSIYAQQDSAKVHRIVRLSQKKALALALATCYMNGINVNINYEKASNIYHSLVKLGNVKAMNYLAGMYRQGFGVAESADTAIILYHIAMNKGDGKAAFNLGTMYKMGEGVSQDYAKAYELFLAADSLGYKKKASQMIGYLTYKGLGTSQSYEKAISYFQESASLGNSAGYYFLGLCYISGNGVEKNIDKGKELMEKALSMGSEQAAGFISNDRIKAYDETALRSANGVNSMTLVQGSFNKISNTAREKLSGIWTGELLCYDFSGKRIIETKPLTLRLNYANSRLSGIWNQSDSIDININGMLKGNVSDSSWNFNAMNYVDTRIQRLWDIKSGSFQIQETENGDLLLGNVEQYSPDTKEPSSPISVRLFRSAYGTSEGNNSPFDGNSLIVSPNPFDNFLNVTYTIAIGQSVTLSVRSLEGKTLYSETRKAENGTYSQAIRLDVPTGNYIVNLTGRKLKLNTMAIKK